MQVKAIGDFASDCDTANLLFCYHRLSSLYALTDLDSTLYYNTITRKLAIQSGHTGYLSHCAQIIGTYYFYKNQYQIAKDSLLSSINSDDNISFSKCATLALSYYNLNKFDSAYYYFKKGNEPLSTNDSILYYQFRALWSKHNNDIQHFIEFEKKSNDIAADEMVNSQENTLQSIEFSAITNHNTLRDKHIFIVYLIILLVSAIAFIAIFTRYKLNRKRYSHKIKELNNSLQELQLLESDLRQKLNDTLVTPIGNDEVANNHTHTAITDNTEITKQISAKYNDTLSNISDAFRILVIQIRKNMKTEKDIKTLDESIKSALTPGYFKTIYDFVDYAYSGLASQMRESDKLNEKETNVICMYLCRLPNTIIRIYTGLSNNQNTIRYRNNAACKFFGSKNALESLLKNIQF